MDHELLLLLLLDSGSTLGNPARSSTARMELRQERLEVLTDPAGTGLSAPPRASAESSFCLILCEQGSGSWGPGGSGHQQVMSAALSHSNTHNQDNNSACHKSLTQHSQMTLKLID